MSEVTPACIEFLLVNFTPCVTLAQDLEGLITTRRTALSSTLTSVAVAFVVAGAGYAEHYTAAETYWIDLR